MTEEEYFEEADELDDEDEAILDEIWANLDDHTNDDFDERALDEIWPD